MKSTLILFDAGAVLFTLNFSRFYRRAGEIAGKTKDEFKQAYISSGLEEKRLSGAISTAKFFDSLRELTGKNLPDSELAELWSLVYGTRIDDNISLKKDLSEKYTVGVFSNASELDTTLVPKKIGPDVFETYGGPLVISAQVRAMKPQPRIYEQIKGFKKIIFIDDKELYLKAAEKFGWQCIHFNGFIDKDEAIRSIHNKTEAGFPSAKNTSELIMALEELGVTV